MQHLSSLSIKETILALFSALQSKGCSEIVGRTKIQKMFFLLISDFGSDVDFDYRLYTYGPYSDRLQQGLDELVFFKSIRERVEDKLTYRQYGYSLTTKGKILGRRIFERLDSASKHRLEDIADKMIELQGLALNQIIKRAYEAWADSNLKNKTNISA